MEVAEGRRWEGEGGERETGKGEIKVVYGKERVIRLRQRLCWEETRQGKNRCKLGL